MLVAEGLAEGLAQCLGLPCLDVTGSVGGQARHCQRLEHSLPP